MTKVSIIIPIYNTPVFLLSKCIDSVVNQNYDNISIVLVNDGSIDQGTIGVLNKYSKNEKCTLLNIENGGAPHARNVGIEWSLNNYNPDAFLFVDGDDFVSRSFVKTLVKIYESGHYDIINSQVSEYRDYAFYDGFVPVSTETNSLTDDTAFDSLLKLCNVEYPPFVMGKLFNATLLNKCRFKDHMKFADDTSFLYRVYSFSKRNASIDYCGYYLNRITNIDSICRTKVLSNAQVLSAIEANIDILSLDINGIDNEKRLLRDRLINVSYDAFLELLPRFNNKKATEADRKQYKEYYSIIRNKKGITKYRPYNGKVRIKKLIFIVLPFLYNPIYRFYLKRHPGRYGVE